MDRLRGENRVLSTQLEESRESEKELELHAREAKVLVGELKEKVTASKRRITELERAQKDLAEMNRGLQDEVAKAKEEAETAPPPVDKAREEELETQVESLTAKNKALTESLRSYSDPEKFTSIKLRELHQQLQSLEATMREKDRLLSEGGKDQLLLGQELEKVRKEKYESQVSFEKRIKELQELLARETREKEKERQERHFMEEQLAKINKKKWPLW